MNALRVLFVDDEEELVSAVVERMQLRGINASGVTSGSQALKMVDENDYEVIILDVRMPGVGGFDVIRTIKEKHPHIEVVMLSGHGSPDDMAEGMRLGAFEYLHKPVDIAHLIDIVRRAAAVHR